MTHDRAWQEETRKTRERGSHSRSGLAALEGPYQEWVGQGHTWGDWSQRPVLNAS